eukprot:1144113-Pelagomonas_calceolata.AAC.9
MFVSDCASSLISYGNAPNFASNHATQHVANWAAFGLAAQCWLGCSTQRMPGPGPAFTRSGYIRDEWPCARGVSTRNQESNCVLEILKSPPSPGCYYIHAARDIKNRAKPGLNGSEIEA